MTLSIVVLPMIILIIPWHFAYAVLSKAKSQNEKKECATFEIGLFAKGTTSNGKPRRPQSKAAALQPTGLQSNKNSNSVKAGQRKSTNFTKGFGKCQYQVTRPPIPSISDGQCTYNVSTERNQKSSKSDILTDAIKHEDKISKTNDLKETRESSVQSTGISEHFIYIEIKSVESKECTCCFAEAASLDIKNEVHISTYQMESFKPGSSMEKSNEDCDLAGSNENWKEVDVSNSLTKEDEVSSAHSSDAAKDLSSDTASSACNEKNFQEDTDSLMRISNLCSNSIPNITLPLPKLNPVLMKAADQKSMHNIKYDFGLVDGIYETCMGMYSLRRPFHIETPCFVSNNIQWFEPINKSRQSMFIIQAIGPLYTTYLDCVYAPKYQVIPVWLVSNVIVSFYRSEGSNIWLPVLSLGSTTKTCPFIDNSIDLANWAGISTEYAPIYAGTIALERAAFELYNLNEIFPATATIGNWKALFQHFGWRVFNEIKDSKASLQINQVARSYFIPIQVAQNLALSLPLRSTETTARAYNTLALISKMAYLNSTSSKITHGQYLSSFPGLFPSKNYDTYTNHVLLINSPSSNSQSMCKLVFDSMFGELLKFLRDPLSRSAVPDVSYFAGFPHSSDVSRRVEYSSHGDSVKSIGAEMLWISHNPMTDLLVLEVAARPFVDAGFEQPAAVFAADLIYTKMAYRAAIIMTKEVHTWIKNPSFQTMVKESLKKVFEKFHEDNLDFISTSDKLSSLSIFRVFALRVAKFGNLNGKTISK